MEGKEEGRERKGREGERGELDGRGRKLVPPLFGRKLRPGRIATSSL